ncbi:alpha/beta fold hydrolase [Micromonospora sp. NPDC048170]|uniref:thioesterase II family protein n=1 Tax=Micromonospora sp. NPDC048170 TaxID=3154819 RepID=UPI0033D35127
MTGTGVTWFSRPVRRPDAGTLLYCLPHAGGSHTSFRSWPAALPAGVEARLVQLPGRATRRREPALTSMETLVGALGPALLADADRPMALYGHSMGGLVAFELLRWLLAHGGPLPRILFVGARRAPHLPRPPGGTSHLTDDEFLRLMVQRGSLPAALIEHPTAARLVLPAYRADIRLSEGYEYRDEAPLPVPIHAYAGTEDTAVPYDAVDAWRRHTAAAFSITAVPGSHFFAGECPEPVIRMIGDLLEQPARPHPEPVPHHEGDR